MLLENEMESAPTSDSEDSDDNIDVNPETFEINWSLINQPLLPDFKDRYIQAHVLNVLLFRTNLFRPVLESNLVNGIRISRNSTQLQVIEIKFIDSVQYFEISKFPDLIRATTQSCSTKLWNKILTQMKNLNEFKIDFVEIYHHSKLLSSTFTFTIK